MAGAGYKLFNTGDVLTAAQVNTYLMEQTVMVFADAAARTTALSGVVSEGMLSYLKDTNAVEVYDGSNWVSSDDPNAIQNSIINAKGDLIAGSANDTPAILSAGSDGSTIVADSAASTGLRWQGNYAAGKNKIINGDFGIWQRGTTFTNATTDSYTADRFSLGKDGTATINVSRQTFTPGTAPVSGYESAYFARFEVSSWTNLSVYFQQRIEDVRTFAGQTITVSFWAKATSSLTNTVLYQQNFGSGGSTAVANSSSITIGTSWSRHSVTFSIPSISGKTIGTNSFLQLQFLRFSAANTVDIWGVQVEAGNVSTSFQTATGNPASELAACQRYYWRNTSSSSSLYALIVPAGYFSSTTVFNANVLNPVPMRAVPTVVEFANLLIQDNTAALLAITAVTVDGNTDSPYGSALVCTVVGGTAARTGRVLTDNSSAGYLAISAEL